MTFSSSPSSCTGCFSSTSCLLVDPVELRALVLVDLLRLEPQGDLLLGALDRVGPMAHVAAHVDGVVAADGARGRCEGVGRAEDH